MIISHEHRYVFVELPRTGCTAVGKELIESYDGERILAKHSMYRDFLKQASTEEKGFFAFSSIRNPLDDAVSGYFKLKSDHHGRFSDPVRRRYRVGNRGADAVRSTGLNARGSRPARRTVGERRDNRRFEYIDETGCSFAEYFMRYYRVPYDTWSTVNHGAMRQLIRFEQLEEDFERVLVDGLGLELRRPLPVRNRTDAKAAGSTSFLDYYTPETRRRAAWVFGPYMARFGYSFPSDWHVDPPGVSSRLAFTALAGLRRAYWHRIR
jgi:hypothetical protein